MVEEKKFTSPVAQARWDALNKDLYTGIKSGNVRLGMDSNEKERFSHVFCREQPVEPFFKRFGESTRNILDVVNIKFNHLKIGLVGLLNNNGNNFAFAGNSQTADNGSSYSMGDVGKDEISKAETDKIDDQTNTILGSKGGVDIDEVASDLKIPQDNVLDLGSIPIENDNLLNDLLTGTSPADSSLENKSLDSKRNSNFKRHSGIWAIAALGVVTGLAYFIPNGETPIQSEWAKVGAVVNDKDRVDLYSMEGRFLKSVQIDKLDGLESVLNGLSRDAGYTTMGEFSRLKFGSGKIQEPLYEINGFELNSHVIEGVKSKLGDGETDVWEVRYVKPDTSKILPYIPRDKKSEEVSKNLVPKAVLEILPTSRVSVTIPVDTFVSAPIKEVVVPKGKKFNLNYQSHKGIWIDMQTGVYDARGNKISGIENVTNYVLDKVSEGVCVGNSQDLSKFIVTVGTGPYKVMESPDLASEANYYGNLNIENCRR